MTAPSPTRHLAMTVSELIARLSDCDRAAAVSIGYGPGPLATLTPTVNGYVILDAAAPEKVEQALRAARAVRS